jgi:hypothetical protein
MPRGFLREGTTRGIKPTSSSDEFGRRLQWEDAIYEEALEHKEDLRSKRLPIGPVSVRSGTHTSVYDSIYTTN